MKRINNLPEFKHRRIELRKHQTPQEIILWKRLQRHLLEVKFKRQHSVGPYILDFYCPERRLAVEVDGSIHKENEEYDKERSIYLEEFGIKTIRFWNHEVDDNIDAVVEIISQELLLRPAKGEVFEERRG